MRAIKAKYTDGRIELPPDLPEREPCEVTVVFPDDEAESGEAKREALRRAAGTWSHLDTEKLKKDIYAARKISTRPKPGL
jgi:hypothetical protein